MHRSPQHALASWRSAATAALLLVAATVTCVVLDGRVSLTSQAMLYLVAVVLIAYAGDRIVALASAVAAVTALNFFFVPPRYTLEVEHREHLIALVAMLGVALLVSWLSARARTQSRLAAESERRARQISELATELLDAGDEAQALAAGMRALRDAFERVVLVRLDAGGALHPIEGLAPAVRAVAALRDRRGGGDRPGYRSLARHRRLDRASRIARPRDRRRANRARSRRRRARARARDRARQRACAGPVASARRRGRARDPGRAAAPAAAGHLPGRGLARSAHAAGRDRRRRIVAAGAARAPSRCRAGAHAGEHRRAGALPRGHHREHAAARAPRRRRRCRRNANGSRSRRSSAASSAGCAAAARRPDRGPRRAGAAARARRRDVARAARLEPARQRVQVQRRSGRARVSAAAETSSVEREGPRARHRARRCERACSSRSFAARRRALATAPASAWRCARRWPQAHGGSLAYAPRRDGGSRFTLALPLIVQPEAVA